ncbi:putative MFS multidrug transporter [Aspergillus clavatus NRRL 1]|uniref:MFS transporter, putative n=1 Tax=Aspergillus clavatus (strain ATCC 1007 / CBS 513.65 / DSM 816 / NCTC 3887 / NRRL 1 / QM 1276 / 107) TaxID=344612 RepID=A1CGK8_ASPCL|nr:MFS transporter, putative [Aspergillus clavatus NRRL 1]EAW11088.1 MFS transporter, putative [Aspergillus clavatus NRRL 1]
MAQEKDKASPCIPQRVGHPAIHPRAMQTLTASATLGPLRGHSLSQSEFISPNHWPLHKKLVIVVVTFLAVINSGIGTSLPSNAVPYLMRDFHVEDEAQSSLPTAIFLVGYIVGPLVFSPLSETIGRRLVLFPTFTVFLLSTVGCALSSSWGLFLFFRFLCGTMGAAPQTVVGGIYADMFFDLRERGRVMAFYMASASFGPILGPIISGFASPAYGWRWTFWIASMVAGFAWLGLIFVPETFGPVLERRNSTMKEGEVEKKTVNVFQILQRPLAMMLFEPIITFTSIYIALAYGLVFFYIQAYPIIFQGVYGFDIQMTSLAFLPVGVGAVSTGLVALYWDMTYDKAKKHNKPWHFGAELHRLPVSCLGAILLTASLFWLAWTSRKEIHWAVPIASGLVFGFGYQAIFVSLLTYVTDAYKIYSASALASSVIMRSTLGALLPLAVKPMYNTLGVSWATSTLGFLSLACVPIPFVLLYKGAWVRGRSKLCQQLMKHEWSEEPSDIEQTRPRV